MRKYRNGKASGEPNRDWKYSPEYLAYRQERGGESVKVSQCDVDLDGTRDSIISKWRNPATKKVQDCGPPFLFWPPTGISTMREPGVSSQPTAIQTLASPQGDQAPTGIGVLVDMDEDGIYSGPDNMPPYDFDDNDPNVGAIEVLDSSNEGPTGITISHPPSSTNEGPTGISTVVTPQQASSGPTGINLLVDMDEDGFYAGPNNQPPYDFDDNDPGIGSETPLTSSNSGPTGISLKVDMDEDGYYSDVDLGDNDPGVSDQVPATVSVKLYNKDASGNLSVIQSSAVSDFVMQGTGAFSSAGNVQTTLILKQPSSHGFVEWSFTGGNTLGNAIVDNAFQQPTDSWVPTLRQYHNGTKHEYLTTENPVGSTVATLGPFAITGDIEIGLVLTDVVVNISAVKKGFRGKSNAQAMTHPNDPPGNPYYAYGTWDTNANGPTGNLYAWSQYEYSANNTGSTGVIKTTGNFSTNEHKGFQYDDYAGWHASRAVMVFRPGDTEIVSLHHSLNTSSLFVKVHNYDGQGGVFEKNVYNGMSFKYGDLIRINIGDSMFKMLRFDPPAGLTFSGWSVTSPNDEGTEFIIPDYAANDAEPYLETYVMLRYNGTYPTNVFGQSTIVEGTYS